MATHWYLRIGGEAAETAAWLAQEAFALVDRLEEDLSRFQSVSYISQLSRLNAGEPLRVSPETYECLLLAKAVWAETDGAFDITVPPKDAERRESWRSGMEALIS